MINEFDSKAKTWDLDSEKVMRAQKAADAILRRISGEKPLTAFEWGCGTGLLSFCMLSRFKKIVCADNSSGMLEVLKEKIADKGITNVFPVNLDLLSSAPLPDDKFDVIYSMLALHHVIEIEKILSSFSSILNHGGKLFIVDLDKEDGSFHSEGFVGHNGFDRNELMAKASNAGFKNIRFKKIIEIIKEMPDGKKKPFPVFLMTAHK